MEFNALSGPWLGWSIQFGVRISERLSLSIRENHIEGTGTDKDGDFEVVGDYDPKSEAVRLTRRYIWTTEPSQAGVGIPYEYHGKWDGVLVYGQWNPRISPGNDGGPFEMWPEKDEEFSLESFMSETALAGDRA